MFSGKQLSKFDPRDRGLGRLEKSLQRFFPERQLIVRSGERMRTLRLSTHRQAAMALLAVIVGSWTLLSSSLVMNHTESIRAKNTEIKDARMGYEQLLAQVSIYKERVSELTKDLETSYVSSMSMLEKESDLLKQKAAQLAQPAPAKAKLADRIKSKAKEVLKDPSSALAGEQNIELALDKAKLERTHADESRKTILAELGELENSMVDVVGHHSKTSFIATEGLEMRQVVLERDMAVSDRDSYAQRVAALEDQIREMESNQLLLYHRFSELAETKIANIESSLSITGLDIDLLVKQQTRRGGQGGPFVPLNQSMAMNSGPIEESLNRLNAQMDRLHELQGLLIGLPIDTPLKEFDLNSGFGVRKDPFTGQYAQHLGLDMGADFKSPVMSTGEGRVIHAGWEGNYGRLVVVDHGMGLVTKYGHLSRILVKVGDKVSRGSVLGQLGCSGRCSGPHVHYEVLHNGKPINPLKFLKAGSDVFKS
ncbi:MAG: peptidoglycan DD-metalloendopeptidase family protein [Rhodospirillaceae bacterium]|nr:peptidoglycan DD-metalloendopeptidase family protein [Rhodospirillaceae bacterium]